jgi:hypothetical protein
MRIGFDPLGVVFNSQRPSNLHFIGRSPPISFGFDDGCQGTVLSLRLGNLK